MKKYQTGGYNIKNPVIPKNAPAPNPFPKSPEDMTSKEKRKAKRDTKKTIRYVKKYGSGLKMQGGGSMADTTATTNTNMTTIKKSDYPSSDAYLKAMDDVRKQGKTVYSPKEASPASWKKMKTGGMVNPNSKVKALAKAGSKGVKSGTNPKASASKRATGRSGGTSTAPKTAIPKAQMGRAISEKAAQRKVAKGKGTINYNYGTNSAPGTEGNKGQYVGFSKEARKSSSPFKSMKNAKLARAIKQRGGAMKRGY